MDSKTTFRFLCCVLLFFSSSLTGCTARQPSSDAQMSSMQVRSDLSPEEAEELIAETGGNFIYGHGVGDALLNTAGMVVFPPYAVYVLGNALLEVGGYRPLRVSELLPEEEKQSWHSVYDGITSVPGRVIASSSGKEFRTRDEVKVRMEKYQVVPVTPPAVVQVQRGYTDLRPVYADAHSYLAGGVS